MSQPTNALLLKRTAVLALAYAAAFLLVAWLDLSTTSLALTRPGASEGNLYATTSGGYAAGRAWLITAIGGVVIEGFLLFGALNADRVSDHWLDEPIRSFGKFYINPLARGVMDRSPLHMLSFTLGFLALRLLATLNNVMIFVLGTAPLGRLVGLASRSTTPLIGFWLVLGTLFYLLAFAASPIAARVLRWLRAPDDSRAG